MTNKKRPAVIIVPDNPYLHMRPFHIGECLVKKGYDVHYIMWDNPFNMHGKELLKHFFTSLLTKQYEHKKITVHKVARLPYYWPYINGLLFKTQIRRLYKRTGARWIFTQAFTNETEVPQDLPFIYDLADDYAAPAELYGSPLYKLAFKLLGIKGSMKRQCKNALAVTALSDILVNYAKQYNQTVLKLPSGVPSQPAKEALADQSTYPKNNHAIIYVSGFGQWSRSVETMQTVVELRQEFPDIDLTLIGPGVQVEDIKKFIKDNHVESFIHYLGPIFNRKRLFRLINQSTIGLNISQKNKFRDACHPAKVLDYSAMGKKVVSTNLAEVEALNFPNVFIFNDSKKGHDLKATLRSALLHKVGKKGYPEISAHVLKDYSWDKLTDSLLQLVEEVGQK